jgi:4-azaleucine resistance transporter AzlC
MLPLSIAVLPWGLLAGSFAIDAGLNPFESQALSAILFAGSAQLVAAGMFKAGAGFITMLVTTFFITSRHFLYSVSMRRTIGKLPTKWRVLLGFLLTDELFALCGHQNDKKFDRWYALGGGLSFYLIWNAATLTGILAGNYLPWLNEIGLDFAVAATFIAIIIPTIKTWPIFIAVVMGLLLSTLFTHLNVPGSLIFASLGAMISGYVTELLLGEKS